MDFPPALAQHVDIIPHKRFHFADIAILHANNQNRLRLSATPRQLNLIIPSP
jgi:hypothetical protein